MKNLADYLRKFKILISSKEEEVKIISEEISKALNVEIALSEIDFHGGVAFLKIKPVLRSELLMKKETILKNLQEKSVAISDLR